MRCTPELCELYLFKLEELLKQKRKYVYLNREDVNMLYDMLKAMFNESLKKEKGAWYLAPNEEGEFYRL